MTEIEILKRKITLKRQYLKIVTDQTNTEIQALESELKNLESGKGVYQLNQGEIPVTI